MKISHLLRTSTTATSGVICSRFRTVLSDDDGATRVTLEDGHNLKGHDSDSADDAYYRQKQICPRSHVVILDYLYATFCIDGHNPTGEQARTVFTIVRKKRCPRSHVVVLDSVLFRC